MSLVGAGGIGKTTLAIELGHRLAGEFGSQICYVDLGSLKAPDLVLPTVAVAVGYTVNSDDLLPGLTSFVADRRLLLILDCCEHVIDAVAGLAAALFREAPTSISWRRAASRCAPKGKPSISSSRWRCRTRSRI